MRSRELSWCFILTMLVADPISGALGQNSRNAQGAEQTVFDAEPDLGEMHVRRPVEIPDSALQVLRDSLSRGTVNCLKSRGTTPDQVPASWFLASAVQLNGPSEVDLIVLPNVPNVSKPGSPGGCLLPASGGAFWVLGPGIASKRYGLLLATYAHRLEVLDSKTNGYRDIQMSTIRTALMYKFTVHQYQLAEKKTEP